MECKSIKLYDHSAGKGSCIKLYDHSAGKGSCIIAAARSDICMYANNRCTMQSKHLIGNVAACAYCMQAPALLIHMSRILTPSCQCMYAQKPGMVIRLLCSLASRLHRSLHAVQCQSHCCRCLPVTLHHTMLSRPFASFTQNNPQLCMLFTMYSVLVCGAPQHMNSDKMTVTGMLRSERAARNASAP
jgi:hypothetical protein